MVDVTSFCQLKRHLCFYSQVGSGTFSVVLEAVHKQSHGEFAVKCVDRRDLHPSDAVALQDEIIALRAVVDCPHIVHLHDVFEEPDTTYLVLERMRGGDLIERIISRAHYTEADAREVCKNLLLGVQFCHGKKIANRNLKPENIFLTVRNDNVMLLVHLRESHGLIPNLASVSLSRVTPT